MYRRIKMNLLNPISEQQARAAASASYNAPSPYMAFRNLSLTSPMIGRVHNVKPGCSSCGKKVM